MKYIILVTSLLLGTLTFAQNKSAQQRRPANAPAEKPFNDQDRQAATPVGSQGAAVDYVRNTEVRKGVETVRPAEACCTAHRFDGKLGDPTTWKSGTEAGASNATSAAQD